MALKPAPTLAIARSPIVNSDGTLTWTGLKQFQEWATQLANGLDEIGNFIGNLQPSVQIVSKPGTIGSITSNLDASGVVTAGGVDFALNYAHKDTDHIADGTGSPLAGGKVAYLALVANAPVANGLLEWDGTAWHWIQKPQTLSSAAHHFFRAFDAATGVYSDAQPAFTDISGTATAAQVPPLSSLTGQITTGQLPASGISAVLALAKLTALGADGTATFTNGLLTAYTPPT